MTAPVLQPPSSAPVGAAPNECLAPSTEPCYSPPMASDSRLSPRLEILGYVPGEITVLAPIAIRDLGPKGVQVESSFPLLLNSVHELRLHLGDDNLVVKGRVAHCRVADIGADVTVYRAGIEFLDAPPHVIHAIEAHVESLKQARNPE